MRTTGPAHQHVTVTQHGDVWRVAWKIPPGECSDATWDFPDEEGARKAAAIIAGWTKDLSGAQR